MIRRLWVRLSRAVGFAWGLITGVIRPFWAAICRVIWLAAALILALNVALAVAQYPLYFLIALVLAAARRFKRRWGVTGAYGDARFASLRELGRAGLLRGKGLIVGRLGMMPRPSRPEAFRTLINPVASNEKACAALDAAYFGGPPATDGFIRIRDFVHLLTCSPAGGGKTVGVIAPNLFTYAGNSVVVDPGGQLFKLSARHREEKLGHKIIRIDPAGMFGKDGNKLNPLDQICATKPSFKADCDALANSMVLRTGKEHEGHWNDAAETVISSMIAHTCAFEGNPEARSIEGVREVLASKPLYMAARKRMQEATDLAGGVVAQMGASLSWHIEREEASVMAVVQRHTHVFDDPLIANTMSATDWDVSTLRSDEKTTVYLIVPTKFLVVWAVFLRVMLATLIRISTSGEPTEANPLLFIVDEAANIGKMDALEQAITLLRGSGIRVWLFLQSLQQLEACYGESAGTILDNLQTQMYMSITSLDTAKKIEERMGETTIALDSLNENSGQSQPMGGGGNGHQPGSWNQGSGVTTSEQGVPLLRASEILRMPRDRGLVFHKNMRPILAQRIYYYSDPAFRWRWYRGFGTGKTRGLGMRSLCCALTALIFSLGITALHSGLLMTPRQRTAVVLTLTSPFGEEAQRFVFRQLPLVQANPVPTYYDDSETIPPYRYRRYRRGNGY